MAMEKLRQSEIGLPPPYIYIDPKSLEVKVPESDAHSNLVQYLHTLLKWLYRGESWYFSLNLQIIQPLPNNGKRDITPDIAVFKNVQLPVAKNGLESWLIGQDNHPIPSVAFEIASKSTWRDDIGDKEKVSEYAGLGVKEYFAYDPNIPGYWIKNKSRLLGWEYKNGIAEPMKYNKDGWIWSNELQTWLVPDGRLLQLYDQNLQRRLTKSEQLELEKREALEQQHREQQARFLTEQKLQEAEKQRQDAERREREARLEVEQKLQDAERQRQEIEKQLQEALEKLRRLEQKGE